MRTPLATALSETLPNCYVRFLSWSVSLTQRPVSCCLVNQVQARSFLPGPCIWPAHDVTSPSSRSTAPPSLKVSSSLNCSATKKAPLLEPQRCVRVGLSKPMTAPYFWTKSARCHCRCRPNYCEHCRRASSPGLAGNPRSKSTFDWSPRPTVILRPKSAAASSGRTSTTA
ncbi:hypothetical protein D3C85_1204370 [compost metagenome]